MKYSYKVFFLIDSLMNCFFCSEVFPLPETNLLFWWRLRFIGMRSFQLNGVYRLMLESPIYLQSIFLTLSYGLQFRWVCGIFFSRAYIFLLNFMNTHAKCASLMGFSFILCLFFLCL